MKLEFGYGKGVQIVEVPDKNLMDVLVSNPMEHERRGVEAVKWALEHPVGSPALSDVYREKFGLSSGHRNSDAGFFGSRQSSGEAAPAPQKVPKIAIITSDISRPLPSYEVLPAVIDELRAAGADDSQITVVFALGSHRHHTGEEKRRLAGAAVYDAVRCEDSEAEDCIHLGTTSRGTPVDICRSVAEADFRICLGNVEFHYFAGYSGGIKAILPGCSTPAAIQANHRMMLDENAAAGRLDGNPLREDLEEAADFCPVDFIVNAVLDEHKNIVYAAAGDLHAAHRDACAYLDRMYRKPIPKKADIVIVSQGGAPKDANLYQTQKALDNAGHAVKDGGTIILIGACNEGLGNKRFEEWMLAAKEPKDLLDRVQRDFQLGGHKAAAIAMVLKKAEIRLVSEMDDDFVRRLFLKPSESAQKALDEALERHGPDASILAMPFGGATLPVVQE
ncbi:MAG: nickel-dependent lactate racemase [Firmicutes bacterium]|nr:nickel-dependent lactate racemase [Bacillota bacterium]